MKVERTNIKACCGRTALAFKIDSPLSKDILPLLLGKGFVEAKKFTIAGMLYMENDAIIVTGPFGSNIIHIKCKIGDCIKYVDEFEDLLVNVG